MINSSGQLFGKINVIDFMFLAVGLLVALGLLAVQSGWHETSGQQIEGKSDILYTVALRNLKTLQPDLFKPDDTLGITIRNMPRGQVKIVSVKRTPKRLTLSAGSGIQTVEDPADPNGYDYYITLRDHATVTPEGYVTEGIKVKIGLPIEVEGKLYRVPGVIVDVQEATGEDTSAPSTETQKSGDASEETGPKADHKSDARTGEMGSPEGAPALAKSAR